MFHRHSTRSRNVSSSSYERSRRTPTTTVQISIACCWLKESCYIKQLPYVMDEMCRRADVTISHAPSFGNRFGLCCLYSNTPVSAPSLRFFYFQSLPSLFSSFYDRFETFCTHFNPWLSAAPGLYFASRFNLPVLTHCSDVQASCILVTQICRASATHLDKPAIFICQKVRDVLLNAIQHASF